MTTAVNDKTPIYTIGHSNHDEQKLLDLLAAHAIDVLVDVRSQPFCGYSTHFNQEPLKRAVEARGVRYLFLGRELGGRPEDGEFYDDEGHVLYGRVAESDAFRQGIERLERGREHYRIALMCSEENPRVCHRWLLVARVLRGRGIDVRHIRGDGRLQTDADLEAEDGDPEAPKQKLLFGGGTTVEIFTIGFTKSTAAGFFGRLRDAGIRRLLDVRLNNSSQLAGFAKRDDLAYFLRELCGAEYVHEPLLAPAPDMFEAYKKHGGDWDEYERRFLDLMSERRIEEQLGRDLFAVPTVLLCSEPTAEHCHRRLVLEYLSEKWGHIESVHL